MRNIAIGGLHILLLVISGCGLSHTDPPIRSPIQRPDSSRGPTTKPQVVTTLTGPPKVTFAGATVAAARVVFCCDASGSMVWKFDTLRRALSRSVAALTPGQSFDLVFFTEDGLRRFGGSLVPATDDNKKRAYEFLEQTLPHGSADPMPGLRAAFASAPETIFLLTDGDFPDNAAVLREIRTLNPGRRVTVHTIAYDAHGKDNGETYEELLQQVASENGGFYRFVSEGDLAAR
jgi:uncharacterized protein with von Willebrand factor type A (vWA) domain